MGPPKPAYQAQVTATTEAVPGITQMQLRPLHPQFPPHNPGQYLTVDLPDHVAGPGVARSYSIASIPRSDHSLEIYIKPTRAGSASTWLSAHERLGDTLTISGPAGTFGPTLWTKPLLLCGAGTGMAPLLAIAAAAKNHNTPTRIFSAAASKNHHLGANTLTHIQATTPHWHIHQWSDTEHGLPTLEALQHWFTTTPHQPGEADLYLCGPTPFCDLVEAAAHAAGIPQPCIHRERFDVPPQ